MTREEFSNKLAECREEAQCGKNELCRRTGFTFLQLQRLEKAANNFSIDNVLIYLKAIGYGLYTQQKNCKPMLFDNRENFSKHFNHYKKRSGLTSNEIVSSTGLSPCVIKGIESGTKNTAIDSLLLCLEKLNCTIEIKKL